ncbi:MAG: phosphoglucosamine mutase [Armatimonadetes bacterium]|nr:phosphoglucosamine mutase [Armatimonadota bacterium]
MSRKHFGTDGIRGVANKGLKPELAMALGRAAGRWLREQSGGVPRIVVGRDTRKSGPMLGMALSAGFNSAGVDVVSLGVAPTPAVSFVARTGEFGLGVIISASHNPFPDNGIKLVGHDGRKLPDEVEAEIESFMETDEERPIGGSIGSLTQDAGLLEDYLSFLEKIIPGGLKGISVAVDCAHGAAYDLGPEILRRLGAEVFVVGDAPDGVNINELGGATKPETIQELTKSTGATLGVAFDGDADRAVFSDSRGRLINGDRTIGLWASHELKMGRLNPKAVVGTVMSNGGFEHFVASKGIHLERTPVGDKYVSQKITALGAQIGGEQSGHIIFPKHGPTGDGLVTMLEVLRVIKESGRDAATIYEDYESWPQILVNMEVADRSTWNDGELVQTALEQATKDLVGHGRINVRASGTQPIVRVMVEADTYDLRDLVAASVVGAITKEAGGKIYSRVDLTHALGD